MRTKTEQRKTGQARPIIVLRWVQGPNLLDMRAFASEAILVGRDPGNDFVLDDPTVSRVHVQIVEEDGVHYVTDLSSRNATRVNGMRVEKSRVEDGDSLELGDAHIEIEVQSAVHEAMPGLESSAHENTVTAVRPRRPTM